MARAESRGWRLWPAGAFLGVLAFQLGFFFPVVHPLVHTSVGHLRLDLDTVAFVRAWTISGRSPAPAFLALEVLVALLAGAGVWLACRAGARSAAESPGRGAL